MAITKRGESTWLVRVYLGRDPEGQAEVVLRDGQGQQAGRAAGRAGQAREEGPRAAHRERPRHRRRVPGALAQDRRQA